MIRILITVSALRMLRDPASLLMTFLLPPIVFLVFASIFSGAAGGRVEVHAVAADAVRSPQSRALIKALSARLGEPIASRPDEASAREAVLSGAADAGFVVNGVFDGSGPVGVVLAHPGRRAAGAVLAGAVEASGREVLAPRIERRLAEALGPVLDYSPAQRRRAAALPYPAASLPALVRIAAVGRGDPLVAYYAGAVSMLFLLFTAVQGAMIILEERASGLRLRLAAAVGGAPPQLIARALWLWGVGVAQSLVIFLAAALAHHLDLISALAPFALTTALAAAAATGLALALVCACENREQAQTVSTVAILLMAAIGGAMAPRFLMPAPLKALGWITPHAWAIETFETVLWRGVVDPGVLLGWAVLSGFALGGFAIALIVETRRRL